MKFSVVIPTYKRPDSLAKTLQSIADSSLVPTELLVIDDHELPVGYTDNWRSVFAELEVDFVYHQKDHDVNRQGLSESKNLGMNTATHEILFYLDDDVIVDQNYFQEIMNVWEKHADEQKLFAVGGKISNNRPQHALEHVYLRIFGLKGNLAWDVNSVGFQCWDESVAETQKAHYIHGGVSSYRRDLLQEFGFAAFSGGRTGLEDVELALRVKNCGFHFYYVPAATLAHYHEAAGREQAVLSGSKESQNRKEIFTNHCSQSATSRLRFAWATIGWVLKKTLSGDFTHARGLLVGIVGE